MAEENYRSSFNFNYGFLDNQTFWVQPPSNRIFRIDISTLRVILALNEGLSIEDVSKKYDLDQEETVELIKRFYREGAIVEPKSAKITFENSQEDISLAGYFLLFCILTLIQIEYFRFYARTFLLNRWQDGLLIAAIAIGVIFFHELGHYVVARRYFKFKPKCGFTFSFIFPAIYVDTNEAWCLPRNKRVLINSAGLLGDFLVNAVAVVLAVNYRHLEYFITPFLLTQYTRLSLILNPLFPTDGYWILSDLTRTVNLGKVGLQNLKKLRLNPYSLYGLLSLLLMIVSLVGLIWFLFNLGHSLLARLIPILMRLKG